MIGYAAPIIGGMIGTGGSLALAGGGSIGVGASISGTQILKGVSILGRILFSVERMGPNKHSNNQSENKQIDYLQKRYGFDYNFRDELHKYIHGRGFDKKIIERIIKEWLGI